MITTRNVWAPLDGGFWQCNVIFGDQRVYLNVDYHGDGGKGWFCLLFLSTIVSMED